MNVALGGGGTRAHKRRHARLDAVPSAYLSCPDADLSEGEALASGEEVGHSCEDFLKYGESLPCPRTPIAKLAVRVKLVAMIRQNLRHDWYNMEDSFSVSISSWWWSAESEPLGLKPFFHDNMTKS